MKAWSTLIATVFLFLFWNASLVHAKPPAFEIQIDHVPIDQVTGLDEDFKKELRQTLYTQLTDLDPNFKNIPSAVFAQVFQYNFRLFGVTGGNHIYFDRLDLELMLLKKQGFYAPNSMILRDPRNNGKHSYEEEWFFATPEKLEESSKKDPTYKTVSNPDPVYKALPTSPSLETILDQSAIHVKDKWNATLLKSRILKVAAKNKMTELKLTEALASVAAREMPELQIYLNREKILSAAKLNPSNVRKIFEAQARAFRSKIPSREKERLNALEKEVRELNEHLAKTQIESSRSVGNVEWTLEDYFEADLMESLHPELDVRIDNMRIEAYIDSLGAEFIRQIKTTIWNNFKREYPEAAKVPKTKRAEFFSFNMKLYDVYDGPQSAITQGLLETHVAKSTGYISAQTVSLEKNFSHGTEKWVTAKADPKTMSNYQPASSLSRADFNLNVIGKLRQKHHSYKYGKPDTSGKYKNETDYDSEYSNHWSVDEMKTLIVKLSENASFQDSLKPETLRESIVKIPEAEIYLGLPSDLTELAMKEPSKASAKLNSLVKSTREKIQNLIASNKITLQEGQERITQLNKELGDLEALLEERKQDIEKARQAGKDVREEHARMQNEIMVFKKEMSEFDEVRKKALVTFEEERKKLLTDNSAGEFIVVSKIGNIEMVEGAYEAKTGEIRKKLEAHLNAYLTSEMRSAFATNSDFWEESGVNVKVTPKMIGFNRKHVKMNKNPFSRAKVDHYTFEISVDVELSTKLSKRHTSSVLIFNVRDDNFNLRAPGALSDEQVAEIFFDQDLKEAGENLKLKSEGIALRALGDGSSMENCRKLLTDGTLPPGVDPKK